MVKIGQMVMYNLPKAEAEKFNGNRPSAPAIVVNVHGSTDESAVNLKVLLDDNTNHIFHKTSVLPGSDENTFSLIGEPNAAPGTTTATTTTANTTTNASSGTEGANAGANGNDTDKDPNKQ